MFTTQCSIETHRLFTNITATVSEMLPTNFSGLVHVYTPHTTAAIALLEDEVLHHLDVRFFLDEIAPQSREPEGPMRNQKYMHDMISLREGVSPDERINGHSHIRSLFFRSSEWIPADSGQLLLGDWKSIFFVELDPMRSRTYYVSLVQFA